MLDVVADLDARGLAARNGFSTTQRLLAGMLQLSVAEARMRVEHAAMVGARRTITGEMLAPRLPVTAAVLDYGQLISAGDARRLACDCKLIPVVLGRDSEPLDLGRALRTVSAGIRRALVGRDGGC
jgi:hypothetical protein